MFKRIITVLFILLSSFTFLSAEESIHDVISEFPEWKVERLLSGETIEYYSVYDEDVTLIAFDGTRGKTKARDDMKIEGALVSGIVTFVPYPESWSGLGHDEKKLRIINTLLYAPDSYSYEIAAYLKDNIFGGNTYTVNYEITSDEIFMTITNVSKLKFFFFTAVNEGELDLCVDVLMTKEGIAIFGLATVRDADEYVKTPVTDVHLPSAFTRRITSLKDWFVEEINK